MNYKITFKLKTPIAFIDVPTFDGVLAYAFAKDRLKGQNFTQKLSIPKEEMLDFSEMPINMRDGYFLASFMYWDKSKAVEQIQKWRKRWANEHDKLADFEGKNRKVLINAATYKSYDMPIRCFHIKEVWFKFQSEDVDWVKMLLEKHIFFLGKKSSQGLGEIESFEIKPSDFSFEGIFRPIPVDKIKPDLSQGKMMTKYCAWQPPYWLPDNFTECFV